jgi:hypothetical protein
MSSFGNAQARQSYDGRRHYARPTGDASCHIYVHAARAPPLIEIKGERKFKGIKNILPPMYSF